MCSFQVMLREVETCWTIWEVKPGPLSDWIEKGSLNRGIMWLRRKSATVWGGLQSNLKMCRQKLKGSGILYGEACV